MKIAFTNDMKLGLNSYAAGDEVDIPDERFAQALITAGHATAADDKPAEKPKKTYKTRQVKAEDDT